MTDPARTILVRVAGRVQGVSFRAWTRAEATRLGLRGWVRNEYDGSVVALLSGPQQDVAAMLDLMWQGPRAARVSDVTVDETSLEAPPAGFEIRR